MDAIYKTEFENHSVKAIIVALNKWFGNKGKLPVKYFDTFTGYSDFCIDEPYVDSGAHLDGRHSHYYNGSTWDSNSDSPNRPKNAAYAAIEYLREEYGIFYSPQMEPDNDHKTKDELKLRSDTDYWFKAARERGQEIMKLRKEIKEQTKHDMDYILTAFRDILDALKIDKSQYVHMDIPSLTRFAAMEAEKVARCLDNYREGAIKFAKDYSSLQKEKEDLEKRVKTLIDSNNLLSADYLEANAARNKLEKEKEKLEKDLKGIKDWNSDLEDAFTASKENLADILEALGISKSLSIGKSMEFLRRHAVQRASLIKSEHDKFMEKLEDIDEIKYRLNDLTLKILRTYERIFNPDPNETCACTAERQLEAMESYISELKTHNESLRKDNKELRDDETLREDATKRNLETLRKQVRKTYDIICGPNPTYRQNPTCARCLEEIEKQAHVWKVNSEKYFKLSDYETEEKVAEMSRAAAYVNTCITDLYKRVFDSAPQNMHEDEMLKRIGYAYENSVDRARGAGQTYKLICDICDKYEIKKPSPDLTLEESIDDILKRFKMILKENQDFRYETEKLYVNMTDLQPSYRMTILDILRAIAEDVEDREEEYNKLMFKYDTSERNRKEWCRKYESEHERANGEHKRAEGYWSQIVAKDIRIGNLEDALNAAASNATGYEALKNTLRKTLDSESRLKFERDSLAEELKKAKDAIRKQNEAILRNERLDEPDDTSGQ